ncbi:hypothetical protein [Streptomyces sp. 5-10]|uniref:hypothetical protein n=1 Tax=Streptomyces sp. 5-10 TaxID=878925 RepID=UPI00168B38C2|nr:hypothetical protein [Streptomyces sp. 5-10]MBD3004690.1 hypothetical protein [Streptomyces sp. 5-10]
MNSREGLTLDQIQYLSGHDTTDGVRMALRRAGVKRSGYGVGKGAWPPKKLYSAQDVWRLFGERICENAKSDPEVKERVREVFADQIRDAEVGRAASEVFGDG